MKKRNYRKHDLQRPKYPCGKDLVLGRREVVKGLGWFFGLSAVGVSLLACTEDYGDGDEPDRGWSDGVAPPYDADAGWSDVPDSNKPDERDEEEVFETQGVAPNYYYDADSGTGDVAEPDGIAPDTYDNGDMDQDNGRDVDDDSDIDDGDAAETQQ